MILRTISRLIRVLRDIPEWFIIYMPGSLGRITRRHYWRMRMKHVGEGVVFGVGVQVSGAAYMSIGDQTWIDDYVILIAGPPDANRAYLRRKPNSDFVNAEGDLSIGRRCHVAQFVTLQAHGGLSIGNDSGIASGARIYSLSHHYRADGAPPGHVFKYSPMVAPDLQALISSPVVLCDDTGVGLNSVILPGSTIGRGSWVGVLSTVKGAIPPGVVASGSPAQVLKRIR